MVSRRDVVVTVGVGIAGIPGCSDILGRTGDGSNDPENGESPVLMAGSNGDQELVLTRHEHVETVGEVREFGEGSFGVRVQLSEEGEDAFYDGLEALGADERPEAVELYTYLDGQVVHTSGVSPRLAERPDEDADNTVFYAPVPDRETGAELKARLEDS